MNFAKIIFRPLVPRRLLVGIAAGMVGGIVVYMAGWWLADSSTKETMIALSSPFRPDVSNVITAQETAESLASAGNTAGGPVQVETLAVAESFGEQGYFNVNLSSFILDSLDIAKQNACLESLIIGLSLQEIAATPAPATQCAPAIRETDPAKLSALHDQMDTQYQAMLLALTNARDAVQFRGGPGTEAKIDALSQQSTILGLTNGQVQLVQSLVAMKSGDVVSALDIVRGYSVSAQSDFEELGGIMGKLAFLTPSIMDWHETHHDAIAEDKHWVDLKVAAGDVERDISFVSDDTGKEYRHLGGVEGSIRLFVEDQRQQHGTDILQAQMAADDVEQHITSAITNADTLRALLQSIAPLTQLRVNNETAALRSLVFAQQIWHLTWGVLAGLIGALLGELMVRMRHWFARIFGSSRAHPRARRYSDAIFPLAGLMLAMLLGVRLTDSLNDLTDTLLSPLSDWALGSWWVFLAIVAIFGAIGTVIGGLAGRFLVPASVRGPIAESDVWLTGVGGVLAGIVVALLLRWLVGPGGAAPPLNANVLSINAQLLALALIGGVFGSLIGATLLSGHPPYEYPEESSPTVAF